MIRWAYTWPDVEHDGTAYDADGKPIGRVYRHPDKTRWQWFSWTAEGNPTGISDSKDEAKAEVEGRA